MGFTKRKALHFYYNMLIFTIVSIYASQVMTWVPPYYISESQQQRLEQNFGGIGMKDGLSYLALQFWVPDGSQASYPDRYSYAVNDGAVSWFKNWGNTNNVKVLLYLGTEML